jgi:EPS-associated MarR family transcriptional regulator
MNKQPLGKEILDILRFLSSREDLTQRDLSIQLGISLGKTNYLLKELIKVGLLEIKNFVIRDQKIQKIKYHLTKDGLEEKIRLTHYFLKEKESEYNNIKKQWQALNSSSSKVSKEIE